MTRRNLIALALCLNAVAALLAGCGALQPPIRAPGAIPQGRALPARGDSSNFKVLYRFHGPDGGVPYGSLIDVHGTLYGITRNGGSDRKGTVYSITTGGTEKVLYSFQGAPDGIFPEARVIDMNGTLFGTTLLGGAGDCFLGCGVVFKVTSSGVGKVLHSFAVGDGDGASAYPTAPLIDVNGTLYGTTSGFLEFPYSCDSARYCGTVFSITKSGKEKVLHAFDGPNGSDGANPEGALIDVNGTLYGTTEYGGVYYGSGCATDSDKHGCGAVFSITPTGTEKVLHSFGNGTDGKLPLAGLVNVKGTLYGTTSSGGTYHEGVVFSISTSGKENVVYNFGKGATDGSSPAADLIDVGGTMYGTTSLGGRFGEGAVYRVSPTGAESVLHSFTGRSDGADPRAALLDVAGILYGTTTKGGFKCKNHPRGCGIVFTLKP